MKGISFIIILFLTTLCNSIEPSEFFKDCSCDKVDLTNGIEISDSLNQFSYIMPNNSWSISRSLDSLGSGLTIGDTTKGFIRIFNISRTDYNPPWDLNKEQAQVEQDFNVIEKGDIYFKGKKSKWNLVFYDQDLPQTYSLYLTYLDEENKKYLLWI